MGSNLSIDSDVAMHAPYSDLFLNSIELCYLQAILQDSNLSISFPSLLRKALSFFLFWLFQLPHLLVELAAHHPFKLNTTSHLQTLDAADHDIPPTLQTRLVKHRQLSHHRSAIDIRHSPPPLCLSLMDPLHSLHDLAIPTRQCLSWFTHPLGLPPQLLSLHQLVDLATR